MVQFGREEPPERHRRHVERDRVRELEERRRRDRREEVLPARTSCARCTWKMASPTVRAGGRTRPARSPRRRAPDRRRWATPAARLARPAPAHHGHDGPRGETSPIPTEAVHVGTDERAVLEEEARERGGRPRRPPARPSRPRRPHIHRPATASATASAAPKHDPAADAEPTGLGPQAHVVHDHAERPIVVRAGHERVGHLDGDHRPRAARTGMATGTSCRSFLRLSEASAVPSTASVTMTARDAGRAAPAVTRSTRR